MSAVVNKNLDDDDDKDNKNTNNNDNDKQQNDNVNKEEELNHSASSSSSSSSSSTSSSSSSSSTTASDNEDDDDDDDDVGHVDGYSIDNIIDGIKNRKFDHIIFMCGAGISTSAGIPDFRSPKTGLYHQLDKYNLPFPEAVFELSFFKANPKPFYHLAKNLLPDKFKPTPCHYFMRLVHDKNLLLRLYTQNIDSLERIAGIPGEKLVEAHGSFHTGHCINRECRKKYSFESMKKIVLDKDREDNVVYCDNCGSYVKPDIIFYGEMLPERFYDLYQRDFINCDLLIVMGTSLTVQPFAGLVDLVGRHVPRLMINKTSPDGYFYRRKYDVFIKSDTDSACLELAKKLDWDNELQKLIHNHEDDKKDKSDK